MLPFTLVDALGWVMIPVVSLTAFLVLCIEQLAVQIENPFGYDANDLPLHSFTCTVEAGQLCYIKKWPSWQRHSSAARPPQTDPPGSWVALCTHEQSPNRSDLPEAPTSAPA